MEIRPKVDLRHLMQEAANNCQTPAITMGFSIADGALQRIAKRACELQDDTILKELKLLGYVRMLPISGE